MELQVLMPSLTRNNLDLSASPYLQQHKDNPIHWQEWSKEVLQHAKEQNKLIFVSIGYATCHWCHVMAEEAFSDKEIADYVNQHYICIKVDREQRPDLDEYFMNFAQKTIGHGGWPLNCVLTPEAEPFFVGTYFPLKSKQGLPAFLPMMKQVHKWYGEQGQDIVPSFSSQSEKAIVEEGKLVEILTKHFDQDYGGFGKETKFPPHTTMIFLLSLYEETQNAELIPLITRTLNAIMNNGLHDHLQGGFYRYCVDAQWVIPHFEKMLYDQAMHLWVFSWAYHLFKIEWYKQVVQKLHRCLEETFKNDQGLYYSAHDADTNHEEGQTYLWTYTELTSLLSEEELDFFWEAYIISKKGNFEGKNHLVKIGEREDTQQEQLASIEEKLLSYRNKREQPFIDKKIITSWNALLGIGYHMASRYCDLEGGGTLAKTILKQLLIQHKNEDEILHSSIEGKKQEEGFLEDIASVLLLCTYLYESNPTEEGGQEMQSLHEQLSRFHRDGKWYMNLQNNDFQDILAPEFDHPIPSAVSLAEFARYRVKLFLGEESSVDAPYHLATQYDFLNYVRFLQKGNLHEIQTPEQLDNKDLPLNSIQQKKTDYQDCYKFQCRRFDNKQDLIQSLRK